MSAVKTKKNAGLSDRTKKLIGIGSGSVVLIVGCWWAFYRFTTVAPPPIVSGPGAVAGVEQAVEFLGNERGWGRMSTPRKEEFLMRAYQAYGTDPQARAQFVHSMHQLTTSQREVLNNGIFDIGHQHMMEHAKQYASLPASQQRAYVERAYNDFETLRAGLGGQNPADSLSEPLKKDMPTSSDEMMKVLVERTDGKERAQAKPFVDAMATKWKEKQKQTNKGK